MQKAQQDIKEKGMLYIYEKIKNKKLQRRKEQAQLSKELKEIQLRRQFNNANRALTEERIFKDSEKASERELE